MNENKNLKKGLGIHARRFIAYVVLILVTFACLFWFYVLFINATRSNGELQAGFTPLPSTHLLENWNNLVHGTLPVWQGMINSLIVSVLSAALCTYFSTMTAYAIHAYDFKLKKYIYAFILAVMMIPTQVTALGFVKLVGTLKMEDTFIPLIVPTIAAPVTFFYMKQYMESTLPVSLIEAARIDGSGEFHTFNNIVLPLMKPAIAVQAIFTFVSSWNNLCLLSYDSISGHFAVSIRPAKRGLAQKYRPTILFSPCSIHLRCLHHQRLLLPHLPQMKQPLSQQR
jgi:multiple sugar transport system permease protein